METPDSHGMRTVAQDAQLLKAHCETLASAETWSADAIINECLGRFDASTLITVIELIGYKSGAALNLNLYKRWLEIWSGRSASEFAIWYNLGVQYSEANDRNNAITSYKNALALKADFYQAALNLGTAYEVTGQTDTAIAVWTKALQPEDARDRAAQQLRACA